MYDSGLNYIPANQLLTGIKKVQCDYDFGTAKEPEIIEKLSCHFKENISKCSYQYSYYDAESETTKYEIKSRRNKKGDYPTTIIAVDKTKTTGRLVFVFHFLDGLFYVVYEPVQFSKYEIKNVSAYRKGGVKTLKPHYFIPIEDLSPILI